jgi:hypothetical protein
MFRSLSESPSSRLHRSSVAAPNAFGAQPKSSKRHACHYNDWPIGKSYPVTAAQLLPILTGFLAPIHFFKLAKNWIEK